MALKDQHEPQYTCARQKEGNGGEGRVRNVGIGSAAFLFDRTAKHTWWKSKMKDDTQKEGE